MERLRHDVAWATALSILEIFNFRNEEKRYAIGMIYERVKDGLLAYDRVSTGSTTAAVTHFHSPGRAACFGWGDAGSVRCSEPTILRPDRAVIFVVSLRLLE
jgi:hypothetical protein